MASNGGNSKLILIILGVIGGVVLVACLGVGGCIVLVGRGIRNAASDLQQQNEQAQKQINSVRQVARWTVLLGAVAWGVFAAVFLAVNSLPGGFIVDLTKKQFGAMISMFRKETFRLPRSLHRRAKNREA